MIREHIITVRNVFISSIFGLGAGYMPWMFLAALMQGQGTEGVGVAAGVSGLVVGTLFPLSDFHRRMKKFSNGSVATVLFTLFLAVWLPLALFVWFVLPDMPTTDALGFAMAMMARTFLIITPPPIGAALITLGMSAFGFKRRTSEG